VGLGPVLKTNRFTIDADACFIHARNAYPSALDATGEPVYFLTADTHIKGFEVEDNASIGWASSSIATAPSVPRNMPIRFRGWPVRRTTRRPSG
jgi:hypothetical protein